MKEIADRLIEDVLKLNVEDLRIIHSIYLATFLRTACDAETVRSSLPQLPYLIQKTVFDPFFRGIKLASEIVDMLKPAVDLSDIIKLIDKLKSMLRNVNTVLVIDCFSPVEFLTYMTKLRIDGFHSELLNVYFTNVAGITRFLTEQVGGSLRKFSEFLADVLNFKFSDKYSYFDKIVHTSVLLKDFVESVPHEDIYRRIRKLLDRHSSVMITSDHGYDVVNVKGLLYVTHPAEEGILKFSNVALYMIAWR